MSDCCPFCGLDPYEYVNERVSVANCCALGNLVYERKMTPNQIRSIIILEMVMLLYKPKRVDVVLVWL